MKEVWKDIKGYEKHYQISNCGRVKSIKFNKEKIIISGKNNRSYEQSHLYISGVVKQILLHRLVAQTFIPNPENKPEVNHIDGNKLNNHVDNLEWNTRKENDLHKLLNGLTSKGCDRYNSKLSNKDVKNILVDHRNNIELSKEYNVSTALISKLKNRKVWKHLKNMKVVKTSYKKNSLGSNNSMSKINEKEVIIIRNMQGKYKDIGNKFNITPSTVCLIKNRKIWSHV